MQVAIGVPSCIYPEGLFHLGRSIAAATQHDHYRLTVLLDGNRDWQRLDRMPEYQARFTTLKLHDDPETDHQRIERNNPNVGDYAFLQGWHAAGTEVIRHAERRGVIAAWNTLAMHLLQTDADYIVIMNDDVVVQPGWLNYLLGCANKGYPKGIMFGFGSAGTPSHPGPAWPGLKEENFWGPCLFLRASCVRELIGDRGWVFNPEFTVFNSDGWFIQEALGRGFDIVSIADPLKLSTVWHRSLGHWVYDEVMRDRARVDEYHRVGNYPAANGKLFTYVRMNDAYDVIDEKLL